MLEGRYEENQAANLTNLHRLKVSTVRGSQPELTVLSMLENHLFWLMELGWWYPWGIVLWRLTNRVGWDSRFWNCAPFLGEVDGSESHIYRGGVCWQEIHQLNLVPDSCSCEVIWKVHRLVILWSWNEMCQGTKAVLYSKIAGIPTARASLRMHQTQKWQPTAGSRTCFVDLCYRKCILQTADSPTLVSDISKWSVVLSVKLPLLKVSEHIRNGSIFGQSFLLVVRPNTWSCTSSLLVLCGLKGWIFGRESRKSSSKCPYNWGLSTLWSFWSGVLGCQDAEKPLEWMAITYCYWLIDVLSYSKQTILDFILNGAFLLTNP